MQKLKTQSLGLFAAPVLIAGSVFLASCSDKEADVNSLELIRAQVPADTAIYFENRLAEGQELTLPNSMESLIQLELAMAEVMTMGFGDEETEVLAENLRAVFIQHFENLSKGTAAAIETYGLATDMASAIYLDGLYPVLQMAVSDKGEALTAQVMETSAKVGGEPVTTTIADHSVTLWQLTEADEEVGILQLAYVVKDNLATLALVNSTLSDSRKAEVLGLTEETASLAAAQTMGTLNETYGFENSSGFVSFVELGNMAVEPEASTAGQDLQALLTEQELSDYQQTFTEQCRSETKALLSTVPRMVYGAENIELSGSSYSADMKFVTELTQPEVVKDLISLNGHQSAYLLNAADKIAAFGFGINGSKLSTALGSLLNKATQTTYECGYLNELQQVFMDGQIRQSLMGTAMLNGVQGMGVGLYDITLGTSIYDTSYDLLLTVAAENPMALVNMVKMFAPVEGLMELDDGKTVDLALPIPLPVELKASVEGNYIGIFSGEKSSAAFEKEAQQALNTKGMITASFNYSQLSDIAESIDFSAFTSPYTDYSTCADLYLMKRSYTGIDGEVSVKDAFTEHGYQMDYSVNVQMPASDKAAFDPQGSYQVDVQEDGCEWNKFGNEEIQQDTGSYDYLLEVGDECAYNKLNYSWHMDGMRLSFVETAAFVRDSCDGDWQVDEDWEMDEEYSQEDFSEYSCIVTAYSDTGFECVMFNGDGKELYRYTRL